MSFHISQLTYKPSHRTDTRELCAGVISEGNVMPEVQFCTVYSDGMGNVAEFPGFPIVCTSSRGQDQVELIQVFRYQRMGSNHR